MSSVQSWLPHKNVSCVVSVDDDLFEELSLHLTSQKHSTTLTDLPTNHIVLVITWKTHQHLMRVSKNVSALLPVIVMQRSRVAVKTFSLYQTGHLYLRVNIFSSTGQLMQQSVRGSTQTACCCVSV